MTLHDVNRIYEHWKRFPPLRVIVMGLAKAYGVEFKVESQEEKQKQYLNADDMKRLLAQTGGRIDGVGQF